MKVIMGVILVIFVVMIFAYFGGGGRTGEGRPEPSGITKVVAVVNGDEIGRETFVRALQNVLDSQRLQDGDDLRSLLPMRAGALNSLIQHRVEVQAAKARGIRVSGRDVKRNIKEMIDSGVAAYKEQYGERANVAERRRVLRELYRGQEDAFREQIMIERLREQIQHPVRVTDKDLLQNYDEVKARHILVSTRQDEQGEALGDAEAKKKAQKLLAEVKGGADFAEVAKRESDDPLSGPEGGDLGWVKRGRMVAELPEFEKAAFALQKGETSGVVKSPFGYHIIRVEDRRRNLPEDFEKNKKQLRGDLLRQRQEQAWMAFSQEQREKAKVTIPDPELRGDIAYVDGDHDQALKDFQTALKQADRLAESIPGAIYFTMGQIYMGRKEWKKAAEALEKAVDVATSEMLPIYVELGRAYLELGEEEQAREYYEYAVDESPEDPGTLWRLKDGFEKLGDEKQAAEMGRLMNEAWQRQMEEMTRRAPREVPPDR